MLNTSEINILGQICNDTFGEYSTKMSPSMSIKTSLSGDILECKYIAIVTLPGSYNDNQVIEMNKDQSTQLTNNYMKNLRSKFKESAGRAMKVKQLDTNDSIEIINMSAYSPKKNAYYRRTTTFRVE
jgi:viroplasmin and RNaseH domain-containing protein